MIYKGVGCYFFDFRSELNFTHRLSTLPPALVGVSKIDNKYSSVVQRSSIRPSGGWDPGSNPGGAIIIIFIIDSDERLL
tara:strand:+ start:49 stop:285 length:237 start_codon:yes stop_codon:yes gene_type:complete